MRTGLLSPAEAGEALERFEGTLPVLPEDEAPCVPDDATLVGLWDDDDVLLGTAAVSPRSGALFIHGLQAREGAWDQVLPALIEGLRVAAAGRPIEAEVYGAAAAEVLGRCGFEVILENVLWAGPLQPGAGASDPGFVWVPAADLSEDELLAAVEAVSHAEDPAMRWYGDVPTALAEWLAEAGADGKAPETWWVLRAGDTDQGVLFGMVEPESGPTSSLQYVCMHPDLRGTGRARSVVEEGLTRLVACGARRHVDATSPRTTGVSEAFEACGLRPAGRRWSLRRLAGQGTERIRCLADIVDTLHTQGAAIVPGEGLDRIYAEVRIDELEANLVVIWRPLGRLVQVVQVVREDVSADLLKRMGEAAHTSNATLWIPGFVVDAAAGSLTYRVTLLLDEDDGLSCHRFMRGLSTALITSEQFADAWAELEATSEECGAPAAGLAHSVAAIPLQPPGASTDTPTRMAGGGRRMDDAGPEPKRLEVPFSTRP